MKWVHVQTIKKGTHLTNYLYKGLLLSLTNKRSNQYNLENLALANLKKACAAHFNLPASTCDILVSNKRPSCSNIAQIPHRKDKVSLLTCKKRDLFSSPRTHGWLVTKRKREFILKLIFTFSYPKSCKMCTVPYFTLMPRFYHLRAYFSQNVLLLMFH